jgi:hypothetical protein
VGVVDDDIQKIGTLIHRIPVLGMTRRIPEIVVEHDIGLIVFAINTIDPERRKVILKQCWKTKARTVVAPDILTFLYKGKSKYDCREWMPDDGSSPSSPEYSVYLSPEELISAIRELGKMAREGDYAELTETLESLNEILQSPECPEGVSVPPIQRDENPSTD